MTEEKRKPVKKFNAGSISATIWSNTIKVNDADVEIFSVTVVKNYKDKEDKWQTTSSLKTEELPKAVLIINKAFEYLSLKESE